MNSYDKNTSGYSLWRSDGSAEGTSVVAGLPTPAHEWSGNFDRSTVMATVNRLYFAWETEATGRELWVSDGTAANTHLLQDMAPGVAGGIWEEWFFGARVLGDRLLFKSNGRLWRTDGTIAGTVALTPEGQDAVIRNQQPIAGGTTYIVALTAPTSPATATLWSVRAEGAPTVLSVGESYVAEDEFSPETASQLFFFAHSAQGWKLGVTDGSSSGTHVVPTGFLVNWEAAATALDGKVYFAASIGSEPSQLWESDGTEAGTRAVASFVPRGSKGSEPSHVVKVGRRAFFLADDGIHGTELWVSDGSLGGATLVADIMPGELSAFRYEGKYSLSVDLDQFVAIGDKLYFSADDGVHGQELWVSDGSAAGTRLVRDIETGSRGSEPDQLVNMNGRLMFRADVIQSAQLGRELWSSDGSEQGTTLVAELSPGFASGFPYFFANEHYSHVVNGRLFMTRGKEIWKTDGTSSGTLLVANLDSGSASSVVGISNFKAVGERLYFRARLGNNRQQLWTAKLDLSGLLMLREFEPVTLDGFPYALSHFRGLAGKLVFGAYDPATGAELWTSDGTREGTRLLKDLVPGSASSFDLSGGYSVPHNGVLYFMATTEQTGKELFRTDGSEAGTRLLAEVRAGAESADIDTLVSHGERLIFTADDGVSGREFWAVKGDSVERLTNHFTSPQVSITQVLSLGDSLLFAADDGEHGDELWRLESLNSAPTIASIAAQTVNAGGVATVSLNLADAESAAADLQVTASASNSELVPASALVISGTGASRKLAVTSAAGKTGSATITVTVSDGQAQASTQFTLTVNAVPAPSSSSGGGGGALAWLALALAVPALARRRSRRLPIN